MEEKQSKKTVSIVKYDGTINSFTEALALCDALDGLNISNKVLLKPNILWGDKKKLPPYGRVTTSIMVDYLLKVLKDHGCNNITIGEGTIPNKEMGSSTFQGFKWTGIEKVAKKYGAKLVDFNSEPYEDVKLGKVTVKISKCAIESDFIIDLPVLKAHRQTKVSLGMKNLKGCLSLKSKMKFHRHELSRMIALLNMKLHPSLTIIDGIYGLEKGPDFLGTPHRMDLIIAGKDVFSCDIIGSMVMGIKPEEVDHLREYASLTERNISLDEIDVRGESVNKVVHNFEWRVSVEDILGQANISGLTVQEEGPSCCSGCMVIQTALVGVLAKDSPNTALDHVEVCIGSDVRAKEDSKKVFLLGDCAISANKDLPEAIKIKGCPPLVLDTVKSIALKGFPSTKAAKILMSRTAKGIGEKLGFYKESFPAFGICTPPMFDNNHF